MLLQTNSYIVPKDKRVHHARLMRRFRQTMHRLGCDQFEAYEQVAANWNSAGESGRFVQIMRFRDRRHQQAVQIAEREDAGAQQLIAEFCNLINLPYQHQQGYFTTGFYTSVPGVAPAPIEEYYEDEVVEEGTLAEGEASANESNEQHAAEAGAAVATAHEGPAIAAEFQPPEPAFGQTRAEGNIRTTRDAQDIPDSLPVETPETATPIAGEAGAADDEPLDEVALEGVGELETGEQADDMLAAGELDLAREQEAPAVAYGASSDEFDALLDSELKPADDEDNAATIDPEASATGAEAEQDLEAIDFDALPTAEGSLSDVSDVIADPESELAVSHDPLESAEITAAEEVDADIAEEPIVAAQALPGTENVTEDSEQAAEDSETVELELASPEIDADFAELTIAVPAAEEDVVTVDDVLAARHDHEHEEPAAEPEPLEEEALAEETAASAEAEAHPADPTPAEPEQSDDHPVIPTIGDAHDSSMAAGAPSMDADSSFDALLADDLRHSDSSDPDSKAGTNGHPAPAQEQTLTDDELFEMFIKELNKDPAPDANTPAR
ncbi:MAG: hypothetical protein JWN51_278 [Phycisphaerales bacterium]|nr:hypothetical protein [Phycisphaerales bacterium]